MNFPDGAQSKTIDQHEHNRNASAKRVVPYLFNSADGSFESQGTGLINESYDYIGITYPTSTTEVYVFKVNGSGGTTVATLTLTYTDDTKDSLSSVART